MAWEARKYKDIIDTLTGNLMQLELNIALNILNILSSILYNSI